MIEKASGKLLWMSFAAATNDRSHRKMKIAFSSIRVGITVWLVFLSSSSIYIQTQASVLLKRLNAWLILWNE